MTSSAAFESTPVGAELAALVADTDPTMLTPDAQVAFVLATERLAAWLQSRQNAGLVAYAGLEPRDRRIVADGRTVVLEDERRSTLALECLWSEQVAHRRLTVARQLASDLPATAAALAGGTLSALRAEAICSGARSLTSGIDAMLDQRLEASERQEAMAVRRQLLSVLEGRCVAYATAHDLSRTRQQVRRMVAAIDPQGAAERRIRAMAEQTDVTITHLPDGMSMLIATMASERAVACLQSIDAAASDAGACDPQERIGVRRAQALHLLLTGGTSHVTSAAHCTACGEATLAGVDDEQLACTSCGALANSSTNTNAVVGIRRGPRVRVNVTIDVASLLRFRDGTAMLEGAGPIPPDAVRELLRSGEASIRWLTTDARGIVEDVSRTYRVGSHLRALITARDGTCRVANCSRPARDCEPDHVVPFDSGGPSTPDNLLALCPRHHQLKTHAGYEVIANADGSVSIRAPHGSTRVTEPEATLPTDACADPEQHLARVRRALDALGQRRALAHDYATTPSTADLEAAEELDAAWLDTRTAVDLRNITDLHLHGLLHVRLHRALHLHHGRHCSHEHAMRMCPKLQSNAHDVHRSSDRPSRTPQTESDSQGGMDSAARA